MDGEIPKDEEITQWLEYRTSDDDSEKPGDFRHAVAQSARDVGACDAKLDAIEGGSS